MTGWWIALGGSIVAVVVVGGLAAAAARHERVRLRAERREEMLLRLLRTDSLRRDEVLEAVVDGLVAAGFDACSLRLVDASAGTMRYVAGRGVPDELVASELPLGQGFAGQVLRATGPLVLDDYACTPGVLYPQLGLAGTIGVPLGPPDAPIALLLAGRRNGRLTDEQQRVALELSEQAGRALEQALRFEAGASDVDQLRALDSRMHDFVSTVSHELRTPLTVVQGLGLTLARRWDDLDPARRTDLTARLLANAERLVTMVATLLASSALQHGRLEVQAEPVVLRRQLEALVDRLVTVRAAHPIEIDVDRGVRVHADPGLLDHVFENLLTNVAKHTPQGTAVRVAAAVREGRVRVSVSDNGPGIAAEDLPHVLERFYRGGEPTRRSSGGLGLGLALAGQIVAAHGSRLEVASKVGRGTTFHFELSEADAPAHHGG